MSGGNWVGYVVGAVVGIVVAVFTAGIGLAAYAGTAGLLAFSVTSSLLVKPSGGSGGKNAVSEELQFASASEAIVAPVIFGTQRIGGNYLRCEQKNLRAVGIYSEPEGGKGGGDEPEPVIVGYNYYLPFDYGLCMGPVDEVHSVWDATSISKLANGTPFVGGQALLTLKGQDSRGVVRLYQGLPDQTRNVSDPYQDAHSNYRGVCYASFAKNFFIGTTAAPKTHAFELVRWPRCYGADGLPVPGLKVRGSDSPADAAYFDANPAAILYEMMTNPVWGRGHSPNLLDIPSFVAASQYYASRKIGLSFALEDQQDLQSLVDSVRGHVNLLLLWTGTNAKCRCMMDIENNGKIEAFFTAASIKNVEFNRSAAPEIINELKVKFMNRENGFKMEIAQAQSDAGIQSAGTVNSKEIDLKGFSNRQIAESQAARILAEMSYPQAVLSFTTGRYDMKIEQGMLIQLDWNEWADGRTQTFWRITEISDANQDADGIQISCVEDLYSVPYAGAPEPYQALIPAWENDTFNTNEDLYGGDDENEPPPLNSIAPGFVAPLNIWASRGRNLVIIGAADGGSGHTSFNHYWSPAGGTEFTSFGNSRGKLITGTLISALPGTGPLIRRGDDFAFKITLDHADSIVELLSSANKIATDADHMQVLTDGFTDLLLLGNEILQIGRVVEDPLAPGEYLVSNYLRAAMGSEIEAHGTGVPFAFIANYQPGTFTASQASIPDGIEVDVRIYPNTAAGEVNAPTTLEDLTFQSLGIAPYTPGFISGSKVGNNWTVKLRPRWHLNGAWSKELLEQDLNNLTKAIPDGYTFAIQPFSEVSPGVFDPIDDPSFDDPNFVADNGKNHTGGTITMNLTVAGADMVRVWSYYQGKACAVPVEYFGT